MLKIAGCLGVSLIDFPGRVATVLFLPGCNFACPYCQNPELIHPDNDEDYASVEEILSFLEERKRFIDGISVTGGEPTIHKDLPELFSKIKALGLDLKIDTNGYLPGRLRELVEGGLVDFVAMDLKAGLDKYDAAAGKKIDISRIEESIDFLIHSEIDHEFRITVVPGLVSEEDVVGLAQRIKGARSLRFNQFSNKKVYDPEYGDIKPYVPDVLKQMMIQARKFVPDTKIRGI